VELTIQRRHSPKCPDRGKGPDFLKCRGRCKLRAVGYDDEGNRVRESLKTRDLARASTLLAKFIADRQAGPNRPPRKTLTDAIAAFAKEHEQHAPETQRKYRTVLRYLGEYCEGSGIGFVDEATLDRLDGHVLNRRRVNNTWLKELEILRQFFNFCVKRKWCQENPAADIKRPKLGEPNSVEPYAAEEVAKIIAACDKFGRYPYERLRARSMVLLMRFAGLRISDVITLSREHIHGVYLVKRAVKNRKLIRVELPGFVLQALAMTPHPKAAPKESPLYFGGGGSSLRSLLSGAERTLRAVFELSGVEKAHPHRFRHTLASELIAKGESIEMVAEILADSPAIIRKHYAKWTPELQSRKDAATRKISGTNPAQAEEPTITLLT
jgi:site-specific recombinase XerD